MSLSQRAFEVGDTSRVGEVRRAVAQFATALDWDEVTGGRAAIVATELATNQLRHAGGGLLFVGRRDNALELLAVDGGPGIDDIERCLADGFSTLGTSGTGLGAVRRQSETFSIYSRAGLGTVVLARLAPRRAGLPGSGALASTRFDWGGVQLPAPGESECGDGWAVQVDGDRATAVLLDGLGHGPLAANAARAGLDAFATQPSAAPAALLCLLHRRLQGTRGAAGSVLTLDAAAAEACFAGSGNVAGRILSGTVDRMLLASHGTLGVGPAPRRPHPQRVDWPRHALAILHSDGLTSRWTLDDAPGLLQQDPAVIAGWLLLRNRRGRDDASVVVVRARTA